MSEDRHPPFDAVRKAECMERMESKDRLCEEKHKAVDGKFQSINGKLNFVLGVCVIDFLAILVAILK